MRVEKTILPVFLLFAAFFIGLVALSESDRRNGDKLNREFPVVVFSKDSSTLDSLSGDEPKASVFFKDRTPKKPLRPPVIDSIVSYAKSLIGTPYHYAGKCPADDGFDCSGFTHHVFEEFGIELLPGSNNQAEAGKKVALSEVKKGDLLIFTGTNLKKREPGHVGIVITTKGERPIKFIHSSSNGGVKISQVENTTYAKRLLEVRRLVF